MKSERKSKPRKQSAVALHELIRSCRGSLKRQPGEKPFAEQMADYKREEKELEEAKFLRMERAGLLPATRNTSHSKRKSKSTG